MSSLDCARSASWAALSFAFIALLFVGFGEPPAPTPNLVSNSPACAEIQANLPLLANAAYAEDLTNGKILYAKNATAQLPLASLTKLMTVATAMSVLSPTDTVTITKEALAPEGDAGFVLGEQWEAADLIDYTLMVSANDGAHALALAAGEKEGITNQEFVVQMNEKAQSLGMKESFFIDDTGLDISTTTAGAYGSAEDVAKLITYLVKTNPTLVEGTEKESGTFISLSGYTHQAINTSSVITSLPGAFAQKTGYTDLAGGNLAEVFEPLPGRPVAAVILGSTRDGRNTDMEALAATAKIALKQMLLCGDDGSESP